MFEKNLGPDSICSKQNVLLEEFTNKSSVEVKIYLYIRRRNIKTVAMAYICWRKKTSLCFRIYNFQRSKYSFFLDVQIDAVYEGKNSGFCLFIIYM